MQDQSLGNVSDGTSTQDTAVDTAVDIVVTAPSSSDGKATADDFRRHTAGAHASIIRNALQGSSHDSLTSFWSAMSRAQEPSTPVSEAHISRFEELMSTTMLPESGPAHFETRRALWCKPVSFPPASTEQTPKLVELLEQEGPLDRDEVWRRGVERVWKGVTGGGKLKRRMPMRYLIKVLQAGWVRDGTWPKGCAAPEPDDELPIDEMGTTLDMPPSTTSGYPSGLPAPTTEFDRFLNTTADDAKHSVRT